MSTVTSHRFATRRCCWGIWKTCELRDSSTTRRRRREKIIRLFPAIKGTPPRSSHLSVARVERSSQLLSELSTWVLHFALGEGWRGIGRRGGNKGERRGGRRWRNRKREKWEWGLRREFFLASRRWACESSTSDPQLVFWSGAPILRYRNASCKPNSNDYERDDTTPLVSHTAARVF